MARVLSKITSFIFAARVAFASTQANGMGWVSCRCISGFTGEFKLMDKYCSRDYAVNEKCIEATMVDGSKVDYPADYGLTCKKHIEPGRASCWNVSDGVELPLANQADWCADPWCFVDPCACDASDAKSSDYFTVSIKLTFSYSTCDAVDGYSKADGTNTKATCISSRATMDCASCHVTEREDGLTWFHMFLIILFGFLIGVACVFVIAWQVSKFHGGDTQAFDRVNCMVAIFFFYTVALLATFYVFILVD